ncbi:chymotrypsin-2-like [Eupeodes corollae]|uniref:chymotrypsin-2-like n=1 Tax=Eupeodes corollae TaxID=290404 RepID=UPI00249114C7|nr:chymotrypsin-2-like [Eupeodes corollae]
MNILYLLVTVFFLFFGNSCHCAKSVSSKRRLTNNRVIGGVVATEPIYYQISLQKFYPTSQTWRHICGGSIIGKSHVLTAAHCTDGKKPEQLSVVVGTSSLRAGGLRHLIKSYVQHESYSSRGSSVYNDVSVIKVEVPFKFSDKVGPISLAENFDRRMENNYPVTLTGWGVIDMYSQLIIPENLMILNYTTISNEECKLRGYAGVSSNELCAFVGRGKGSCLGDSGGPLVNRDRNILIGLVSYGSNICASNKPDVYVRVSKFIPWIQRAVKDLIP